MSRTLRKFPIEDFVNNSIDIIYSNELCLFSLADFLLRNFLVQLINTNTWTQPSIHRRNVSCCVVYRDEKRDIITMNRGWNIEKFVNWTPNTSSIHVEWCVCGSQQMEISTAHDLQCEYKELLNLCMLFNLFWYFFHVFFFIFCCCCWLDFEHTLSLNDFQPIERCRSYFRFSLR